MPIDTRTLAAQLDALIFSVTPAVEGEGLSDADRQGFVDTAMNVLLERKPGTHNIYIGAGAGGAGQRHMPIALLTDDMPFLVDSVSAAIGAEGLDIQRLFHPILLVRRDETGGLISIDDPDAPRESLVLLEARRAPARKRARLARRLDDLYADARATVEDWKAMLALVRATGQALDESPPPLAPHVVAESIAFLDWLVEDNFTLIGAIDGETRLGVMRHADRWNPPAIADEAWLEPVLVRRSPLISTVHRIQPLDLVVVRRYDHSGQVQGVVQFFGLFTSAALRESANRVPLLRRRVAEVTRQLGLEPRGHDGRALVHVIEAFPRAELLQLSTPELLEMATALMSLQNRPRPEVFVRHDPVSGGASIFAWVPRDDYSSRLRERFGEYLVAESGGRLSSFDVELGSEPLARVHYTLDDVTQPPDQAKLGACLLQLTRGWEDELEQQLTTRADAIRAARLTLAWGKAFGPGYRAEFTPADAAEEILRLAGLSSPKERRVALFRRPDDPPHIVQARIYRLHEIIPLSDSVPILENFGFRVIEEMPWELAGATRGWIHHFTLELPSPPARFETFCELVRPALTAVLEGDQENDSFNALIPACGLTAEEANWFRAWFRYLRQTGFSYGFSTAVDAGRRNPDVMLALVALFRARLGGVGDADAIGDQAVAALDAVQGIDDDRILRLMHGLIMAILRTNAFLAHPQALAFKLDSARVPGLPKPCPWREIWVYSARVEGVHLRGGPIARGGLRWSDRRDDFRHEVLGLMKAQMVKNSIIVPTGAKGGFYPKHLPSPAEDREAWLAEGRASYEVFIRALLSITDNRAPDGRVIPAADVVRLDGDDSYLVVAADKGTASFSDTANAIAESEGFWLGDAFASGGSAGYDHKEMGITARGAWVSVTRHFAEAGVDVQSDSITVAGVGDMSGDVFGNGLLLSKTVRLVAAFDHRHIFLDPSPDPARSWQERRRLYDLPRSSWADYDPALISEGGGVFLRSQKRIPLSPQVRTLLYVEDESLDPAQLMAAILRAPVDLIWFGGIGTYIKSVDESHADAGDRANDALRVDGKDVRARVIGEGANLGVTQAARIEYARKGGRINTDFIDNSAGVDTSDHEVNIKIALSLAERAGRLQRADRNALLAAMTDEVAELVLADNVAQTRALSVAEASAAAQLPAHARLIESLETAGLDRQAENLPDARDIDERARTGTGLTRPELAVLLSEVKNDLKQALVTSPVSVDPLLDPDVSMAFPATMRERFADEIAAHPLRRELAATKAANLLVNRGGLTLANAVASEPGCANTQAVGSFVAARTLFDLPGLWRMIDTADIAERLRLKLHTEAQAVTWPLVRDLCRLPGTDRPADVVARLESGIGRIFAQFDSLLRPEVRSHRIRTRNHLAAAGSPMDIADRLAVLHIMPNAISVVALARDLELDEIATAEALTRISQELGTDWVRGVIATLAPDDMWERLLVATTLRTIEQTRVNLLRRLAPKGSDPRLAVDAWIAAHAARVSHTHAAVQRARQSGPPSLAMLAHLAGMAQTATLAE
ncbi:MAG: NAD-glutamate dehydrogenase domain-containing protein [Sphingomonadaceae bacterium]